MKVVHILDGDIKAFLVDIFTKSEGSLDSEPPKHVGMGFIYPENFKWAFCLRYLSIELKDIYYAGKQQGGYKVPSQVSSSSQSVITPYG